MADALTPRRTTFSVVVAGAAKEHVRGDGKLDGTALGWWRRRFVRRWRRTVCWTFSETDTAIEAKLDLPGVKPEEVEIQLNGNVLTISGERKEEEEEKGKTFHRVERRVGQFSRSMSLPCPVEEDEVAASYKDGVLTIMLPKNRRSKNAKDSDQDLSRNRSLCPPRRGS